MTRFNILAERLNVRPPRPAKMVQKLTEMGLLDYEVGIIRPHRCGPELEIPASPAHGHRISYSLEVRIPVMENPR